MNFFIFLHSRKEVDVTTSYAVVVVVVVVSPHPPKDKGSNEAAFAQRATRILRRDYEQISEDSEKAWVSLNEKP